MWLIKPLREPWSQVITSSLSNILQLARNLFAACKEGYIDAGIVILLTKQLNHRLSMEDFMQEYEEYAEDFSISFFNKK
jgi:hypothetical protein